MSLFVQREHQTRVKNRILLDLINVKEERTSSLKWHLIVKYILKAGSGMLEHKLKKKCLCTVFQVSSLTQSICFCFAFWQVSLSSGNSPRLFSTKSIDARGCIDVAQIMSFFCLLEPHAGFKIAFNMFDADGNEMVDRREFMVVWLFLLLFFINLTLLRYKVVLFYI